MTYPYGKNLLPSTVGFDRLLSTMEEFDKMLGSNTKQSTYPFYNIVKVDENRYEIQIAVAGFASENIDIETVGNKLTVIGSIPKDADTTIEYLHHGLSSRDFKQVFTLSDTIVVRSADIVNGVLKIVLENIIPEERKPRKIQIGFDEKPLLTKQK